MSSLQSLFLASGLKSIEYEGRYVSPFVVLPVETGDRFQIEWVSTSSDYEQGLGLRLRKPGIRGKKGVAGQLLVAGVSSSTIMLWRKSALSAVPVDVASVESGGVLRITNSWRSIGGREDELLNNFGIEVLTESADCYLLRCSDGAGAPDFNNLVVRLTMYRADRR